MNNSITTFETGKNYTLRFIGDADLKPSLTVIKRTAKTVTVKGADLDNKRCGIKIYDNVEYILPYGSYSMAPSCKSSNII